jgi:hypothetical protein
MMGRQSFHVVADHSVNLDVVMAAADLTGGAATVSIIDVDVPFTERVQARYEVTDGIGSALDEAHADCKELNR